MSRSWSPQVAQAFAEEWGLSLVMVLAHAAEAQRQLEAAQDLAQVRGEIDALLYEAAEAARSEDRPADRARALVAVARERRELAGIGAHRDPRNDPKPAPPAEPFWVRPKSKEAS